MSVILWLSKYSIPFFGMKTGPEGAIKKKKTLTDLSVRVFPGIPDQ